MIYEADELQAQAALDAIRAMACAARTAPKARGMDGIAIAAIDGKDKDRVADEMQKFGEESGIAIFVRDAKNLRASAAALLIGVRNSPKAVPRCGYCGFPDCAAATKAGASCALCTADLGIAVGSAAAAAADRRVDTRVMFTVGKIALALGLLEGCSNAYGLPVSITGKSPYFDRA